jgi:hypothetical protein
VRRHPRASTIHPAPGRAIGVSTQLRMSGAPVRAP